MTFSKTAAVLSVALASTGFTARATIACALFDWGGLRLWGIR